MKIKLFFQDIALFILKRTNYKFKIVHSDIEIVLECKEPIDGSYIDDVRYIMYAKNIQGANLGNGRWKTQGESWKDGHLRMIESIKKSAKVIL